MDWLCVLRATVLIYFGSVTTDGHKNLANQGNLDQQYLRLTSVTVPSYYSKSCSPENDFLWKLIRSICFDMPTFCHSNIGVVHKIWLRFKNAEIT